MKKYFIYSIILNLLVTFASVAQWKQITSPNNATIKSLVFTNNFILAGTNKGIYQTSNGGLNWLQTNIGLSYPDVTTLEINGSYIFAGTDGGGIFRSENGGSSWAAINNGLEFIDMYGNIYTSYIIDQILLNEGKLFALTNHGAFVSLDNGTSWNNINGSNGITSLSANESTIFLTGQFTGVSRSIDNGNTWERANTGLPLWYDTTYTSPRWAVFYITCLNNSVFITTDSFNSGSGLYRSTNNGEEWLYIGDGIGNVNYFNLRIISHKNNLLLSNRDDVYISFDNGDNWYLINDGLPDEDIRSLYINNDYAYAVTFDSGIWLRPLSEIITNIRDVDHTMPMSFDLSQNYPNPFNPTTTINYSIPQQSFVTIKIYDVLGKEVTTLVNEEKSVGNYSVVFNASDFSSGIYFYSLHAGGYFQTKKLAILK